LAHHDLIDEYTHLLSHQLRGFWPQRTRILEEVRGHLLDGTKHEQSAGASLEHAQQAAVERFGSAQVVARRFADERLSGSLKANLSWFGLAALGLLAANSVDELFARGQVFAPDATPSFTQPLVFLGWALELLGLPLLVVAWRLCGRYPYRAAQVWTGALLAAILGFMGIGWGRMLANMAVTAATGSPAGIGVRTALVVAVFVACGPVLLAADAHGATTKEA
jgi:hypothetical protein